MLISNIYLFDYQIHRMVVLQQSSQQMSSYNQIVHKITSKDFNKIIKRMSNYVKQKSPQKIDNQIKIFTLESQQQNWIPTFRLNKPILTHKQSRKSSDNPESLQRSPSKIQNRLKNLEKKIQQMQILGSKGIRQNSRRSKTQMRKYPYQPQIKHPLDQKSMKKIDSKKNQLIQAQFEEFSQQKVENIKKVFNMNSKKLESLSPQKSRSKSNSAIRIRSKQHHTDNIRLQIDFKQPSMMRKVFQQQQSQSENWPKYTEIKFQNFDFVKINEIPLPEMDDNQLVAFGIKVYNVFQIKVQHFSTQQKINVIRYEGGFLLYSSKIHYKIIWNYSGAFYVGELNQGKIRVLKKPTYELIIDAKTGMGYQFQPQQYTYMGQFMKKYKNGTGKIVYQNGDKYEGQWQKDLKSGKGKFYEYKTNSYYDGQWYRGYKQGFGFQVYSPNQFFQGTFHKNIKEGFGAYIDKNGSKYKGEFLCNKFHGKGKYFSSNGEYYEGYFKEGLKNGQGKWKSKNGDFYYGNFEKNKKSGYGIYISKEGNTFQGIFANDKFEGSKPIKSVMNSSPSQSILVGQSKEISQYDPEKNRKIQDMIENRCKQVERLIQGNKKASKITEKAQFSLKLEQHIKRKIQYELQCIKKKQDKNQKSKRVRGFYHF